MTSVWLNVFGLTEKGVAGMDRDAIASLSKAQLVIAPERVLPEINALSGFEGEAMTWPQPFLDIIPLLEKRRGENVVICATGDPLWYGAASTLQRYFSSEEMCITPAASGFQWASARMGWPQHELRSLTVHGRPHENVLKYIAPKARLLVIAHDRQSPGKIAKLLDGAGYGDATMTILGHIGGAEETRHQSRVGDWHDAEHDIPDFHVMAIECPASVQGFLPLAPGLPDHAFDSDGKLTKSEVRAATLSALNPHDGGILWDLGCGSGAIGIEWMRAANNSMAYGVDDRQDRLDVASGNAIRLGVPMWQAVCAKLPQGLEDLPDPDSVFIGGGLTVELVGQVLSRLRPNGRLVVNTVTLESEAVLLSLWQDHGGDLKRIAVSRADPVGPFHGWRPLMPVTQWVLTKSGVKEAK